MIPALGIVSCSRCELRCEQGEALRWGVSCTECGSTADVVRVCAEVLETLDLAELIADDEAAFSSLAIGIDVDARASDELVTDVRDEAADVLVRGADIFVFPIATATSRAA